MFVPMRNYGKFGFIDDTPASMLPIGAWNQVRNVRFKGNYIEKCLEPDLVSDTETSNFPAGAMWAQQFYDGNIVRIVVATRASLWLSSSDTSSWVDVTREGSGYLTPEDGYWQSFAWGLTCVFNNGTDAPQVFDPVTDKFIDMPNWGIITSDTGTENFDTQARARFIVPYKSFLVACNVTESIGAQNDSFQPNTVWWSDGFQSPDLWEDQGNVWDYNSTTNLAGKNQIGLEAGPIQWAATLGEGLIIYNSSAATQMLFTGGGFVMDFRRLFDYGCVGLYGAAEFLNQHYVVGSDVMYIHDGNTVKQVSEDRVRNWFYRNVKNLESSVRVITDYTNREVIVQYDALPDVLSRDISIPESVRLGLVYNYDDDNYTVIDAAVDRDNGPSLDRVVCMVYGLDLDEFTELGPTWDDQTLRWDEFGDARWGQLQGGATSQTVRISMFWLTATGLYRANKLSTPAPNKRFIVTKSNMDLDEINPQLTTNLWKHIRQIYPHIVGLGLLRVRLGWSPNLETAPAWGEWKDYRMLTENAAPEDGPLSDVKIDCRTTGRYLAIEWDFAEVRAMRFTGIDIDVLPVYGR